MTTRNLDFSDGFESSASPTAGTIAATGVGSYANDAAYVTAKGSAAAAGDIYFNTTTGFFRVHNGTQFDDYVNATSNQTVSGDKTFDGNTLFVNTTNLEVTDKNINVNNGGNDATAEGAGLNVERTGTDGSLVYEDALTSKWKAGAVGSEVELANVSGSQTLTNKTVDGNNNTLTVLAASQLSGATPIANGGTGQTTQTDAFDALSPTTTKGDITVHNGTDNIRVGVGADGQSLVADSSEASGVKWDTISGGGGGTGINHIDNPDAEVDTTGWTDYADAAGTEPVDGTGGAPSQSLFRSTSGPLRGTAQFALTKGAANRQGEGFSYDFTIDEADLSKPLTISFDYADDDTNFAYNGGVPGDESDIMIFIYDVTNSTLIRPLISGLDGSGRFVSSFQADATSTSYRLIFHIATTNANSWGFTFDNVSVGPSATAVVPAVITDWEEFTPVSSWTGGITLTGRFRRVGDEMEIQVHGDMTGAITPTSTEFSIDLPNGLQIDTNKFPGDDDGSRGQLFVVNTGVASYQGAARVRPASNPDKIFGRVFVDTGSFETWAALDHDSPATWGSGDELDLWAKVPIAGWSSGRTSAVAVDSNRPVSARYTNNITSAVPNTATTFVWATKEHDTHGAMNTSTGVYTIPVTGDYFISSEIMSNGAVINSLNIQIHKNGSVIPGGFNAWKQETAASFNTMALISRNVRCNAGDTIEILHHESVDGSTYNASAQSFEIYKIDTGSPLAALTEKVQAIYEYGSPSDTNLDYNAFDLIEYSSKIKDTHNSVSAGVFTAPVTGYYQCTGRYHVAGGVASGTTREAIISIFVNGSEERRLETQKSHQAATARSYTPCGTALIYLEAGDQLDFRGFQNITDATALTINATSHLTWMSISKVD